MPASFLDFLAGGLFQFGWLAMLLYLLGDLFESWIGDDDPDPVRSRVCEAMRALAPFEPRLIGSVSTGHIRRGSDVDLQVFTADDKLVAASPGLALNAHLNVLEFYYMRRNADKFEAAAEAMYAQLPDPNAPEWQGALLMGRDLCPTHPMFSDGDDHAGATSAFADPFASVPKFEGHEPKAQAPVQDDDFDFDLGTSAPAAPDGRSGEPDRPCR